MLETNVKSKLNTKKIIVIVFLLLITAIICFVVIKNKFITESIKNSTNFISNNLQGVWKTDDGRIIEYYSDGNIVEYKPYHNSIDAIKSEIESIIPNQYEIVNPNDYNKDELRSYSKYLKELNEYLTDFLKANGKSDLCKNKHYGLAIKSSIGDKYVLHEFASSDFMVLGRQYTLEKIDNEQIINTNPMGIYIAEPGQWLSILEFENNPSYGYYSWIGRSGSIHGLCTIDDSIIRLKIGDMSDFVFQRNGSDLIEIGSEDVSGSKKTYIKCSNLNYLNKKTITDTDMIALYSLQNENVSVEQITAILEENVENSTFSSENTPSVSYNGNDYTDNNTNYYTDDNKDEETVPNTDCIDTPKLDNNPKTGDIIEFGQYSWKVLEVYDNQALIITDHPIEQRQFNEFAGDVCWADCSLRNYLNNEFYESFSTEEKSRIVELEYNNNPSNTQNGTSGCGYTNDKVFLLSMIQAEKYDIAISGNNPNQKWWLRTPGLGHSTAAVVSGEWEIMGNGLGVSEYAGVRPACWIKINS